MRIYIVGAVASGKSTFARKLSQKLNISYRSLDEIVYEINGENTISKIKREPKERDEIFKSIIEVDNWIIEDVGRSCFEYGLKVADRIILIEINKRVRNYRIIKRFIKQKLGVEKCSYKPNIQLLKDMFRWSNNYDLGKDKLKDRICKYREKTIILKNSKEINNFLNNY